MIPSELGTSPGDTEAVNNFLQRSDLFQKVVTVLFVPISTRVCSTWICSRCLEKVQNILPNGGLMVIYHGTKQKMTLKQIQVYHVPGSQLFFQQLPQVKFCRLQWNIFSCQFNTKGISEQI